jgi:hypothetical protein
MEAIYGAFDWEAPIVVDEAEIAGDWIFSRSRSTLSGTPKEGGERQLQSRLSGYNGLWIFQVRKSVKGV